MTDDVGLMISGEVSHSENSERWVDIAVTGGLIAISVSFSI